MRPHMSHIHLDLSLILLPSLKMLKVKVAWKWALPYLQLPRHHCPALMAFSRDLWVMNFFFPLWNTFPTDLQYCKCPATISLFSWQKFYFLTTTSSCLPAMIRTQGRRIFILFVLNWKLRRSIQTVSFPEELWGADFLENAFHYNRNIFKSTMVNG